MAAYLLTWNPEKWYWSDLEKSINELYDNGKFVRRWSCGNTKRICIGDRIFIIKIGKEPRGIFASGYATSACYQELHWDDERANKGDLANYIDVDFDVLLSPFQDIIYSRQLLDKGVLSEVNWSSRSSGIIIPEHITKALEDEWRLFIKNNKKQMITGYVDSFSAEEVFNPNNYFEGATKRIYVNTYERNANARRKCINHYGTKCSVCDLDFSEIYGKRGEGFIHVHHIIPLYKIKKDYQLDPIKDLRPICPNCHAMIHRFKPELTIEELILLLKMKGQN